LKIREDVEELITQAIGEASMCWEHVEKAGTFDSDRASKISQKLCNDLMKIATD